MATPQEELAELNRQIADLKRQLGDTSEFIPLQNLKDAQRLFTALKRDVSEIGDSLSYVAQAFRDSVAELSKQNTELNNSRSALKSISNISQKILVTRSLDGDISTKELASLEKRAKLQFKSLELAVKSGRLRGDALKEAQDALKQEQKFFDAVQGIRKEQEEIGKNSGVRLFTGLEEISNAIPGLGKFTSAFKDASTAAKEQARFNKAAFGNAQGLTKEQRAQNKAANSASDQIKKQLPYLKNAKGLTQDRIKELGLEKVLIDKNGKTLAGTSAIAKANALTLKESLPTAKSLSPFKAGIQSIGPALAKALGPLAILQQLFKALKFLDATSGRLAKSLGTSYEEGQKLTEEFAKAASESNNLFINTQNLVDSQIQIGEALGTNAKLNSDLLVTQTELTKMAGYSVETATQLSTLSLATGESSKDITTEFLGQVKALNAQNGLAINEKQLLEGISKISKGTLATFAGQTDKLSAAVFAAKKLGLEISQVEKIADGLLDIESSLTAEFEAEVISGKQLNLERARYFALTNQIGKVADELGKQGVTQASFAKSSRIEQEAVAKAMGMSRDELGAMLIEQKAISAIGADDAKGAREKFEALKAQKGEAAAIAELGDETYARQLASISAQEKFAEVSKKLQDIFVSLAGPILDVINPIVEVLGPALAGISSTINYIKGAFEAVVGTLGVMIPSLGKVGTVLAYLAKLGVIYAAYKAYASFASNPIPVVGAISGGIAAAGILAAGFGAISGLQKAGDVMSPADGKTVISTKEGGLFELSKNDDVLAAPNLFGNRGNDRNLQPTGATNVTVSLSKGDIMAIANAVREGASQAKISINLDGNAVANNLQTPMAMNTRTISV
jgi:hypothetical protein